MRRWNRIFEFFENVSFFLVLVNKDNDEYESGLKW